MIDISELENVQRDLAAKQREVHGREAEMAMLRQREDELCAQADKLQQEIDDIAKVLAVFHKLAESVQESFIHRIEALVTAGIRSVFDDGLEFKIVPTVRGKAVNLDFQIVTPDGGQADLMNSFGGGLVTLVGVILRVVMIRLLGDRVRQVLILDEALSMLSLDHVDRAGRLLYKLSHDLGIQIIMITHQTGFLESADTAFRVEADGDHTMVVQIESEAVVGVPGLA